MVNLQFLIDKEADVDLWLKFLKPANSTDYGKDWLKSFPSDFTEKLLSLPEDKQPIAISNHIEKYYSKEYLNKFQIKSYNKIKGKLDIIIERLEKVHNRKLPVKNIIVKYETFTCCPYIWQGKESDTFGLYFSKYIIDKDEEIVCFAHELMHLFFHYYFFDYCISKGLSENQTHDLKESLTVFLDTESSLSSLMDAKDGGYFVHQKLRELISEEWNKLPEKNFEKLLDIVIEKMKF